MVESESIILLFLSELSSCSGDDRRWLRLGMTKKMLEASGDDKEDYEMND